MRELGLFETYLLQLRAEKLKQGHEKTLKSSGDDFADIKATACEAELVSRLLDALRELAHDPGQFIKERLRYEQ